MKSKKNIKKIPIVPSKPIKKIKPLVKKEIFTKLKIHSPKREKDARDALRKRGIRNPTTRQIIDEVLRQQKASQISEIRNSIAESLHAQTGRVPTTKEIDEQFRKMMTTTHPR
jgi:hypothetical protein